MPIYIVSTQYMENYGAHNEPVVDYWKMKGGSDYRVTADRYQDALAKVASLCENNEYFKEWPIGHETEADWLRELERDTDKEYFSFLVNQIKDVK